LRAFLRDLLGIARVTAMAEGVTAMTPQDFPQWGVRSSVCLDPDGNPVEIAASLSPP
jgi:hypothetical protein